MSKRRFWESHRRTARLVLLGLILAMPSGLLAQGTAGLSGTAKDASGAVLPGVNVEASSPALIEKTRSVVTDGAGQYKVVSLPPGTYTVTFTLPGFSTVKREGIELTTGFTATINADLKVGGLEESITVSGDTPIVDVQNVKRQVVMTRDVVDALPTGKTAVEIATLIPGVQLMNGTGTGAASTGMGGSLGMDQFATLAAHGGRPADTRIEVNGVNINIFGSRQDSTYANFQDGNVQEYSFEYSAHSAESETGGVRMNIIPKDGGNTFRGQFFANFANDSLQGNNMTDALKATGLRDPDKTQKIYTVNPSFGGPIVKDKLWFYGGYSRMWNERLKAGTYFNTDLAAWRPNFDLNRQATAIEHTHDSNIRLTWQASPKHKIAFYYDYNKLCQCPYLIGATYVGINAPEGATLAPRTTNLPQVTWTAPFTSRLLAEVTGSFPRYKKGHDYYVQPLAPRITESTTGVSFRAANPSLFFDDINKPLTFKGSVSYVTGSHALKTGVTARHATAEQFYEIFQDLTFTTLNYRPVSVSYQATPYYPKERETALGFFVQDQWTMDRMTVNAGIRYDYYMQGYPDIHLPATKYVPNVRDFPAADLVRWKDLSPRVGVAYNLFGNGKTAVKASISRFNVQGLYLTTQNPARANVTMTRAWTDPNGDFIIDGDPFNPNANGELGASQNRNFGLPINPNNFDPSYAFGYGKRPFNWETSASIQHQLVPRVSVNAGYFRRWYGNFEVTDNILVGPSDFTPYSVTVPSDNRLPNAGTTITGLYDLNPNKVGQTQTITTSSANYGKQTEHWNGVDLSAMARLPRGVILQGGLSTGKTTTDNCEILAKLPENVGANSTQYCNTQGPWLTQVKFGGSYTLPFDIQISGTLQSFQGPIVTASATYTNAQVAPVLGRSLSQGTTATVALIQNNTQFGNRLNQVDLRLAKLFKVNGSTRLKAMMDVFNLGNVNTITGYNTTYGTTGATWKVPTSISLARLIKFGVQLDF